MISLRKNYTCIHSSYHKCLTKYFDNVLSRVLVHHPSLGTYRHFNSKLEDFYNFSSSYRVSSINNQSVDLDRFKNTKLTRFIRDPRDLVVSGYFYHKRGAEDWCNIKNPTNEDWVTTNGNVPKGLLDSQNSYSSYLASLNQEKGLIEEIKFRKYHFESMMQWNLDDNRIKLYKYEDIIGNESKVFRSILSFYGFSWRERRIGRKAAQKMSAKNQQQHNSHIRNSQPLQWRKYFTPKVNEYFNDLYAEVLEYYNYSID